MATAPVAQFLRTSGKGAQPAMVQRLRDAEEEITALRAERASLAAEIEALSRRIVFAITAGHPGIAIHVAGRLDALAHSLQRRGAA